jgi:hypothetical protein
MIHKKKKKTESWTCAKNDEFTSVEKMSTGKYSGLVLNDKRHVTNCTRHCTLTGKITKPYETGRNKQGNFAHLQRVCRSFKFNV